MKSNPHVFPEDTTDHIDILLGNLGVSAERSDLVSEQTLFHIRELAAEIAAVCDDAQSVAAFLSESEFHKDPGNFPAITKKVLTQHRKCERFFYRMCLLREIGKRLTRTNPLFLADRYVSQESVPDPARGKIGYQQNHLSDRAYLVFSGCEHVKNPKAVYHDSFTDICEKVYNGMTEYGILPAGNSSDGKLLRFVSLIEKYDLKISAACEILSENGTINEFVLIQKNGVLTALPTSGKTHFQFSVVPENPHTLSDLLNAADFCSMCPERIDSLPVRDGATLAYFPVFRTDGADLLTFFTYLSVDLPQAVPIGLYQKIQENEI